MKDLTEREVVIAVIALSSKLRLLSHHQYKTIGHLMIFLIHFTFTFILIYSSQSLYRSNAIALLFAPYKKGDVFFLCSLQLVEEDTLLLQAT